MFGNKRFEFWVGVKFKLTVAVKGRKCGEVRGKVLQKVLKFV